MSLALLLPRAGVGSGGGEGRGAGAAVSSRPTARAAPRCCLFKNINGMRNTDFVKSVGFCTGTYRSDNKNISKPLCTQSL